MGDLDQDYAIQQKLFDENVKYCTEELAALADAIKMLYDNDALELLKETLPAASASFMQVTVSSQAVHAPPLSLRVSIYSRVIFLRVVPDTETLACTFMQAPSLEWFRLFLLPRPLTFRCAADTQ